MEETKPIYTETTKSEITGAELRGLIIDAARECEEEEDIEGAKYFYKKAAEIESDEFYLRITTDSFYSFARSDKR